MGAQSAERLRETSLNAGFRLSQKCSQLFFHALEKIRINRIELSFQSLNARKFELRKDSGNIPPILIGKVEIEI